MRYSTLLSLLCIAGMAEAQNFKPVQLDPFGINIPISPLTINDMQFADLNNDGAFDIIFNDENQGPFILVNTGEPGAPDFNGVLPKDFFDFGDNQVGNGTFTDPTTHFVDIDNDGDLDILGNISSDIPSLPAEFLLDFNVQEQGVGQFFIFGLEEMPGSEIGLPNLALYSYEPFDLGDLDGDGDLDILSYRFSEETSTGNFVFYESNAGTSGGLAFNGTAVESPFGLPADNPNQLDFGFPALADLDEDSDLDLMLSTATGDWRYFENKGTPSVPNFPGFQTNPFGLTAMSQAGAPYFMDVNQDGYWDILSASLEHVYYYEAMPPSAVENAGPAETSLHLFPNPAHASTTATWSGTDLQEMRLLNPTRQTVWSAAGNLHGQRLPIILDGLAPGVYWLEARCADGQVVLEKLVKI